MIHIFIFISYEIYEKGIILHFLHQTDWHYIALFTMSYINYLQEMAKKYRGKHSEKL